MSAQVEAGLPDASLEVRAAFRRLLLSLADSKRLLGIRYSDWLLGAPSIEAGIAASSMAQDEWGHARLLYASLKEFDEDPTALEHDRPPEAYTSMEALDVEYEDWAQLIAGAVVVDGALAEALEAILEGPYASIHGRLSKMLGEEEFHRSLAEAWFRRLAGSEEGGRRLRGALERSIPTTLRAIAPGDDAHTALADAGLYPAADVLRERLRKRLTPLLALLEMEMPPAAGLDDGWDGERGRGAGAPAEEAIERARGDLNRELFVE